jgi:hypothetical protein
MNVSKTVSTIGVGAAIVAGSMLAVTAASAHSGVSEEKQTERASALAERFNLDESEVQSYFEDQRAVHKAEREAEHAEHIAGLIEAGTLTQAQADELTALKDEAKASIEALKESGANREEIKKLMDENRSAVETWASEQGINLDDIRSEGHEKGGRGHHGPRGDIEDSDSSEES